MLPVVLHNCFQFNKFGFDFISDGENVDRPFGVSALWVETRGELLRVRAWIFGVIPDVYGDVMS